MITTRNRREELRRTLGKLLELQPAADEILICADGCTDKTSEMVRQDFPSCILLENDSARGSVFSRDRLLRTASGDIVLSLDDDSYPLDRDFFARLDLVFEQQAGAAVITFPEIRDGGASADPTKLPSSPAHLVSAYPNCAAAMRRETYLRLGGYVGDGAVVDEQFNTTDVCVLVKTDLIAERYSRHYDLKGRDGIP